MKIIDQLLNELQDAAYNYGFTEAYYHADLIGISEEELANAESAYNTTREKINAYIQSKRVE